MMCRERTRNSYRISIRKTSSETEVLHIGSLQKWVVEVLCSIETGGKADEASGSMLFNALAN
jgi:hypothetical protein